jgi:hypothetical protein
MIARIDFLLSTSLGALGHLRSITYVRKFSAESDAPRHAGRIFAAV